MVWVGVGLLVAGVALGAIAWYRARLGARPVVVEAPPGRTGEVVEVEGIAHADGEPQVASLSATRCVWHAHEVRRHYRNGVEAEPTWDRIADDGSTSAFVVADAKRGVLVVPGGAWPQGAGTVLSRRIDPPKRGERGADADLMRRVTGRISGVFRGETLAFEYLEWAVGEGAGLRVRGRVGEHEGRPAVLLDPAGDEGAGGGFEVRPGAAPRRSFLTPVCLAGSAALAAGGLLLTATHL